jgi:hypothetical protein
MASMPPSAQLPIALHLTGLACDVRRDVLGGERTQRDPVADRGHAPHAVDAERAPVVAVEVVGEIDDHEVGPERALLVTVLLIAVAFVIAFQLPRRARPMAD